MIVVMGILGIASMGAMQLMVQTTKITKTSEIGMEINAVVNSITQNLLSSDSCSNTFKDVGAFEEDLVIDEIKNRTGQVLFNKTKKYGNNRLKINEMSLKGVTIKDPQPGVQKKYGEFKLQIKLEKQGKNFYGQKYVVKNLPLQGQFDLENHLTKCYSATEDAVYTAKKDSCQDIGGTWVIEQDTCELNNTVGTGIAASTERVEELINDLKDDLIKNYVQKAGDTMTGNLQVNAEIGSNNKIESATQLCVGGRCRTFNQELCPQGKVVSKINEDGTVVCSDVTCPSQSTFFVGVDSSGNPICKPFPSNTCSANEYISKVNTDGSVECSPLPPDTNKFCPKGTAIQRITSSGNVTCTTDDNVFGKTCNPGQYLRGFTNTGNPICHSPSIQNGPIKYTPTTANSSAVSYCPAGFKVIGCHVKMGANQNAWPTTSQVSSGLLWLSNNPTLRKSWQVWNNGCVGWSNHSSYTKTYSRLSLQAICIKFN